MFVSSKDARKVAPPKAINIPTLYPDGHSVNPKKVADLQKMIPFIPPQFRDFYSSLVDHPVTSSADND